MTKKPKKTIQLIKMIDYINWQLSLWYYTKEYKSGLCDMADKMLHEANSYRGFMFLESTDNRADEKNFYSRKYFLN
jgi:hypothetical protein